nr:prolipoprotein diacylglyceryl transferase [Pseudomonadota bacterium]
AYFLANYRAKQLTDWNSQQIEDLIFYGAIGVIVGGRLGYMLFYNLPNVLSDPLSIFAIQGGGMSFHGGFLGVLFAMALFNRKYHKSFFATMDFVAPLVPLGLGFGRMGNFINGELWGKVTTSPFGMFIQEQGVARYPSQLYEAFLEGLVLFIILWVYSQKLRPLMSVSALFLIFYGLFRFIIEFVRVPDAQLGYLAFNWLTMGQLLSLPMIIFGVYLFYKANRKHT